MEKKRMIITVLCVTLAVFMLCACALGNSQAVLKPQPDPEITGGDIIEEPDDPADGDDTDVEEPICGGVTDKTDPDASKSIKSDEITDFYTNFYLAWRWRGDDRDDYRTHQFEFSVKPDGTGKLSASESNSGVSLPADEKLLKALQAVIREDGLESENGVYEVTAGLPPEYWPCELTVSYDSGEKLTFTEDNNPDAEWAEDIYDIFAGWFKENGDDSLYPDKYTAKATRFSLEYYDHGEIMDFSTALKDVNGNTPVLPDDYYDRITEIFSKYDMALKYDFSMFNHEELLINNHDLGFYGMSGHKPDYDEPDSEDAFVDIYVEYDDGDRFNIETKKESEIEGMKPMLDEFAEYHRELGFASGPDNGEVAAEPGSDKGADAADKSVDNGADAGNKGPDKGADAGDRDSDNDPDAPEPVGTGD